MGKIDTQKRAGKTVKNKNKLYCLKESNGDLFLSRTIRNSRNFADLGPEERDLLCIVFNNKIRILPHSGGLNTIMKLYRERRLLLCVVFFYNIYKVISINVQDISVKLDKVFIQRNLTLEESKVIFANAKESYAMLKDFQMRETQGVHFINKLKVFTSRIIRDVEDENLNVIGIFKNMCSYLKDDTSAWILGTDTEVLKLTVETLLKIINQKLGDHYAVPGHVRQDVERILSLSDNNIEAILRKQSRIDVSNVAFFFLEVFATLLGLSWGIISMTIGKPM